MSMLSDAAYQSMADLLNMVEAGAPWPQGTINGRVAFLEKEGEGEMDPKF